MQSTEFNCPQRRNEFWQTKSKPSVRTSLPEECVVKVVKENREDNYSQDLSSGLERTRGNTPKYLWDHKNSDVSSMPRETERYCKTWYFDPVPSESQLARREFTRTSSTYIVWKSAVFQGGHFQPPVRLISPVVGRASCAWLFDTFSPWFFGTRALERNWLPSKQPFDHPCRFLSTLVAEQR